jgi:hypothetical protein
MTEKKKKERSKQKGSRDANKPSFYVKVLDEAERLALENASGVDGIDDEIALLRVKIKSLLEKEPENILLILKATNTLANLVKMRYNITQEQRNGIKEAIGNVLRDIAVPLGITIGTALNK